jgi:superfamily I DNA/RNA helicase
MIEMATGVVEPFEIVVVDEAQDLTNKQWELVLSMVKPSGQLYVAGDDDQAVYTWCGANPHTMVDMATSREVLRQSYRIPASVHRLADKVVHRINRRAEKEYLPRNVEGSVEYSVFYEPMMYTNKHTVLCRDKWVMKEIEDVLVYHALSYTCNSHTSMYDGGKANLIRAIIAEDFAAIKRMARYLHKQYQEDPYSAVKAGWKKSVDLGRNETEAQYLYLLDHEVEPLVHLSTIHGAKGEEDNHIVLMAHCSGKVEEAMDNAVSYDDELRVWYVGITRAKEKLTVVGYNQYIQ